MPAIRSEIPVGYATMVKRTIVHALRAVFTTAYPEEEQFKNLRIFTDWPLERLNYPTIIIDFQEGPIEQFGIAHKEWFRDPNNILRAWKHAIFHGNLDFEIYALSPLDRDILGDALLEVLLRFPTYLTEEYFNVIYGAPNDPYSALAVLNQLNVDSDRVNPTGNNTSLAPWEPEDVMIYQKGYSVALSGGFYNTPPTGIDTNQLVSGVDLYPYLLDSWPPPQWVNDTDNPWSEPWQWEDEGQVAGNSVITTVTDIPSARAYTDTGSVQAKAVITSTSVQNRIVTTVAATATSTAVIPGQNVKILSAVAAASSSAVVPILKVNLTAAVSNAIASSQLSTPKQTVTAIPGQATATGRAPALFSKLTAVQATATGLASAQVTIISNNSIQGIPATAAIGSAPIPTVTNGSLGLGDFIFGDTPLAQGSEG